MHRLRLLVSAMGLISFLVVVKYMLGYFVPFVFAAVLAMLIQPLVDRLGRSGCPRSVTAFLFVVLSYGGLIVTILLCMTGLWREMEQLASVFERLLAGSMELTGTIELHMKNLPAPLPEIVPMVGSRLSQFFLGFLAEIMETVVKLPGVLFSLMVSAIATYFLIRDQPVLASSFVGVLPQSWRRFIFGLKREVVYGILAYLRAQLILVALSATLSVIGFLLLGIPYPWVLGLLAGFLDLIPMIGPSGVFLPLIAYYMLTYEITKAVSLLALWGGLLLLRQWWEPQIVGNQLGMHPLSSLIAIYLGVRVLGFAGFFVGPLVVVICKAWFVVVVLDHTR